MPSLSLAECHFPRLACRAISPTMISIESSISRDCLKILFYVRSIATEDCLREWLQLPNNAAHLRGTKGIGPKTVDYLKMLVGIPAVAVDRHIRTFVHRAGFRSNNYTTIREVVEEAGRLIARAPKQSRLRQLGSCFKITYIRSPKARSILRHD